MSRQTSPAFAVILAAVLVLGGCTAEHETADGSVPAPSPDSVATTVTATPQPSASARCDRTTDPSWSVARVWNEVALEAIRRDFPAPTVHARNLFHLSAAMWDAWVAYDETGAGYYVDLDETADDVAAAREAAISHAASRILRHRYADSFGAEETLADVDATMAALCHTPDDVDAALEPAVELGSRIGQTVIDATRDDGAREADAYLDDSYTPVNDPLDLRGTGPIEMADPNRWQPLAFDVAATQNQIPLETNAQTFVGSHWGDVDGFALPETREGLPLDPGPPPYLGDPDTDAEFRDAAVEVIRYSSLLDPADTEVIDISPAALGDNSLGTNDGDGYEVNPVTGEPYEPQEVPLADFGRVVAEYWADGPESETPPGHWNTLANKVSDTLPELRVGGDGPVVDRLEWDVKLYLALNGATHDAAIAAWGAKSHYDYVRPISMIRWMGGLGQSSDPDGPSYHPDGLPLVEGLVEVVTDASSAQGERHERLADYVGEVTVRSWDAYPRNPEADVGGVDWILATEWVPYQRATFVTPAFAGYVSGHSAFSRAAAEVMTGITGSPWFPDGLGSWTVDAEGLEFEAGPAEPVVLQWASYYDAADQAGQSRLYGGIHVRADDLAGRVIGATCGEGAWALAQAYFSGAAAA
ncbi:MAG: vanadium-dependent haloperoxidase [Actinomycetota bacterium]